MGGRVAVGGRKVAVCGECARIMKRWGYDYWDGDRRICYGGYRYMPGRWAPVAASAGWPPTRWSPCADERIILAVDVARDGCFVGCP